MAEKFNYMTGKTFWTKVLGNPVPNYNRDGNEWTFDFTPDEAGLALINELGLDKKLKNKGDERGDFIQFKQKEERADGTKNFPITVVDARNRPWDPEVKIGNGSTIEVKFKVVEYKTTTGVYVQAIRVLDLAPYVRQEFAPLPEDNEYVQRLADTEFPEVEEDEAEAAPAVSDPLNVE